MKADEKSALNLRARAYLIANAGYTSRETDLAQAGNQAWRHLYQFARREVDRAPPGQCGATNEEGRL